MPTQKGSIGPLRAWMSLPTFRRTAAGLASPWKWFRARRRRRGSSSWTSEGLSCLAVLTILLVAASLARVNLLILIVGMLLGLLWLSTSLSRQVLRGLEVRRRLPHNVCAGDLVLVDIEIANTRRRLASWGLAIEEQIHRENGGGGEAAIRSSLYFPHVPAGAARRRIHRGRLPRRGRYYFAPLAISTGFPFGFFRRTVVLGGTDALMVYPRLGQLTPRWLKRRHDAFEGSRRREHRQGLAADEFYGVRPWRTGDQRRHVHWRSTARRGTLVVRQFERHHNRDVAVVLELWEPAQPREEHRENVELAVSFAATVIADTCRRGGNVLLAATADEVDGLRGPGSIALMHEAMTQLAVAEAASEDRLPNVLRRVLSEIDLGTDIVVVSTRPVDLTDSRRLGAIWNNPTYRAAIPRIRTIDAGSRELFDHFEPA
jgi:uncharacterized protein (DUF58 family)